MTYTHSSTASCTNDLCIFSCGKRIAEIPKIDDQYVLNIIHPFITSIDLGTSDWRDAKHNGLIMLIKGIMDYSIIEEDFESVKLAKRLIGLL